MNNEQINIPRKLTGVPGCVRTVERILTQGMEYTRAVGVRLLKIIEELVVTDMDEQVQVSERRLVNLRGVEGVAQEAWQMATVAWDATENIQAMRD